MTRIWAISDTHCKHKKLIIPENIDIVIHAGDASNHQDWLNNESEMREFLRWFDSMPIKHKIYIPGNHDTSIEKGLFNLEDYNDINFLIHRSIIINGIKIFGSPYTPSFGNGWAYNVPRHKLEPYWSDIDEDTDIIVTHGPPKGILDYTRSGGGGLVQCGCKSLMNRIEIVKPKYHIFGHIHDEDLIYNAGIFTSDTLDTTFVNASINNLRYYVTNNGQILEY